MLKNFLTVASLAGLLSLTSVAHSQALPTAVSHGALQAGIGWSYAKPDYGTHAIQGVSGFGDFDFTPHIGVEAEFHYISFITPTDLGENSFLVGPRFVLPRGRYNIYGKALIGIGDIQIQLVNDNPQGGAGKYSAYAVGAGVDVRATRHVFARADFEYQRWSYLHGLTPTVLTVGVGYRFR
ncbi:MAG: porin family protein [Acidobacteriota bacterium]|nr:porin family protein [Acidobacteriota bacterium]